MNRSRPKHPKPQTWHRLPASLLDSIYNRSCYLKMSSRIFSHATRPTRAFHKQDHCLSCSIAMTTTTPVNFLFNNHFLIYDNVY